RSPLHLSLTSGSEQLKGINSDPARVFIWKNSQAFGEGAKWVREGETQREGEKKRGDRQTDRQTERGSGRYFSSWSSEQCSNIPVGCTEHVQGGVVQGVPTQDEVYDLVCVCVSRDTQRC